MKLSTEDIRRLAQQERDMDAGKIPFVLLDGERVALLEGVLEELGLEQGQTINNAIFRAIIQKRHAIVCAEIAARDMAEGNGP